MVMLMKSHGVSRKHAAHYKLYVSEIAQTSNYAQNEVSRTEFGGGKKFIEKIFNGL
jgi:hypothetical protein